MTEVFLYADETGNLDYQGHGKGGASAYFGFGTAISPRDHPHELWEGHKLRGLIPRSSIRRTPTRE